MCTALDNLMAKSKTEGKIEGKIEGIQQRNSEIILKMLQKGCTSEFICDILDCDPEKVLAIQTKSACQNN